MNSKIVKKLMAVSIISAAMFAQAATEVVDGITWTYTISGGKASVGGGSYCSATLLPTEDGYLVFVYLAPKGLPAHAKCVEVK